jgi:hypothetical protein
VFLLRKRVSLHILSQPEGIFFHNQRALWILPGSATGPVPQIARAGITNLAIELAQFLRRAVGRRPRPERKFTGGDTLQ